MFGTLGQNTWKNIVFRNTTKEHTWKNILFQKKHKKTKHSWKRDFPHTVPACVWVALPTTKKSHEWAKWDISPRHSTMHKHCCFGGGVRANINTSRGVSETTKVLQQRRGLSKTKRWSLNKNRPPLFSPNTCLSLKMDFQIKCLVAWKCFPRGTSVFCPKPNLALWFPWSSSAAY